MRGRRLKRREITLQTKQRVWSYYTRGVRKPRKTQVIYRFLQGSILPISNLVLLSDRRSALGDYGQKATRNEVNAMPSGCIASSTRTVQAQVLSHNLPTLACTDERPTNGKLAKKTKRLYLCSCRLQCKHTLHQSQQSGLMD